MGRDDSIEAHLEWLGLGDLNVANKQEGGAEADTRVFFYMKTGE